MKVMQHATSSMIGRTALALVAASSLGVTTLMAGAPAKAPAPVVPAEEPFVTGTFAVAYDTHFISFGQDVWALGNDWGEWMIHPSVELDFNLGGGLQAYINVWADVNDQVPSTIGGYVQELDLNVGFYYTIDKLKLQLGYYAWDYASQTEQGIFAKASYSDGLFNPFVAVNGRTAIAIPGYDEGLVYQAGIAPGTTLGPVALSFPITVSFDTEGYHAAGSGFAYVSGGIAASLPLTKDIALTLGVTYYHTQEDVIPNPDSDFITGSAGIVVTF